MESGSCISLFCNCSAPELRWFIDAICAHLVSLETLDWPQAPIAIVPRYFAENLVVDLDERKIHAVAGSGEIDIEDAVASFLAGLTKLCLDSTAHDTIPKQSRIRCKNTAFQVMDSVWRRLCTSKDGVRLHAVPNLYKQFVKAIVPGPLDFAPAPGIEGLCHAVRPDSSDDPARVFSADVKSRPGNKAKNGTLTPPEAPETTLVIPAAGRSSRFPGHKPKWMLTQPNGTLMIVDALRLLDLSGVSRVVVGLLNDHFTTYCKDDIQSIFDAFSDGQSRLNEIELTVVVLKDETVDQVQTIQRLVTWGRVKGAMFVKDCDNQFACKVSPIDGVATLQVTPAMQNLNIPGGKSYAKTDPSHRITNIAEKSIISSTFCVGGYSFASSSSFTDHAQLARKYQTDFGARDTELAVSDIIWLQTMRAALTTTTTTTTTGPATSAPSPPPFSSIPVTAYEDWGTISAFQAYQRTFRTLFVDIDGTLLHNSGPYFGPRTWAGRSTTDATTTTSSSSSSSSAPPLAANVRLLRRLHATGRVQVVLTTARTERFRDVTERQLRDAGVPYDQIVFGLLHAQRVLVNDFAKTNPYPSAVAVNLKRDADDLGQYLETFM